MAFVIAEPCIDVTDRSCVDECPVDCIYEGARKLYIQPEECIDCGACEPVCPVEAISADRRIAPERRVHRGDNAAFFELVLPGRDEPLGSPGGASALGAVGSDTPLVSATPEEASTT
ncbi:ferredoxin [Nocardioides sp. LHG3406-4]|uniref:ferredoxin n=1 Tax=Nocardioides sp. LHG3406-4 TaxID=2804575 RepID=UPI003CFBA904